MVLTISLASPYWPFYRLPYGFLFTLLGLCLEIFSICDLLTGVYTYTIEPILIVSIEDSGLGCALNLKPPFVTTYLNLLLSMDSVFDIFSMTTDSSSP